MRIKDIDTTFTRLCFRHIGESHDDGVCLELTKQIFTQGIQQCFQRVCIDQAKSQLVHAFIEAVVVTGYMDKVHQLAFQLTVLIA